MQMEKSDATLSMLLPIKLSLVRALDHLLNTAEGQFVRTFIQQLKDGLEERFSKIERPVEFPVGAAENSQHNNARYLCVAFSSCLVMDILLITFAGCCFYRLPLSLLTLYVHVCRQLLVATYLDPRFRMGPVPFDLQDDLREWIVSEQMSNVEASTESGVCCSVDHRLNS